MSRTKAILGGAWGANVKKRNAQGAIADVRDTKMTGKDIIVKSI